MGDGERGHLPEDRAEPGIEEKKTEDEEDVVEAARDWLAAIA